MTGGRLNQLAISRIAGGEGFELRRAGFGPMFSGQLAAQLAVARASLFEFPRIGSEHDETIRRAFERVRNGLSADRFLCDPMLSRKLWHECKKLGIKAPEAAINLRLLAIRKARPGILKQTERIASTRDVVERLGLGVEAAMRFMSIRYGASVDDFLAHPELGEKFEKFAKRISKGGNAVDYRLCALQIRKGRHISGVYEEKVDELGIALIKNRWHELGTVNEAHWKVVPQEAGLIELRTSDESLYIGRTRHIGRTLEASFGKDSVVPLFRTDYTDGLSIKDAQVRCVGRSELPIGTPKSWELFLIQHYRPRYNWPVDAEAA